MVAENSGSLEAEPCLAHRTRQVRARRCPRTSKSKPRHALPTESCTCRCSGVQASDCVQVCCGRTRVQAVLQMADHLRTYILQDVRPAGLCRVSPCASSSGRGASTGRAEHGSIRASPTSVSPSLLRVFHQLGGCKLSHAQRLAGTPSRAAPVLLQRLYMTTVLSQKRCQSTPAVVHKLISEKAACNVARASLRHLRASLSA